MDPVIIRESRLQNHMDRCRCCLKKFEVDSQTVQVTKLIENLFFDLTRIQLKNSEKYSNLICIICKKDLIYFSDLKRILTAKQLKIYEFVEEHDKILNCELKEHHQQLLVSRLDFELIDEENIKTEQNIETPTVVVNTIQWPELRVDDISEISHIQFNEQITKQIVVRRKTGRSKKGRLEYFCEICKIFVSDTYRYKLHYERFHLKIKNNFCDKCGFAACSKAEILSHFKYIHFPKQGFPCTLCDKVLATSAYRSYHIKMTHHKTKSHCCEVCGFRFQKNLNLQRHIQRVHEKVTNFKCNEPGCDKAYYLKRELQTHHAVAHITRNEIICEYCEKVFFSQSYYKIHVKSHINPQWQCDLCSEKFFKKGLLTDHKRTKHWDNH